jgi:hypothetical protein
VQRLSPQLICFSYHKSGTSLFLHVMTKVCRRLGLTLANHYGRVERLDPEQDVVLLPHSVLRGPLDRPYRAIRLIRDPRDIWVSGYLYHLRCDEGWCRNTDMDPTPPIGWPQVDYSVAHWPEEWKRHYLERLSGKSYQQNLLDCSLADGLDFELAGYTGCTFEAMREWKLNGAEALDVKLEDLMADFDGTMLRIFDHFEFTAGQSQAALEVARSEDVRHMDDAAIARRPQIQSRKITKWRDVLSTAQIADFEQCHGGLIRDLGYQMATVVSNRLENHAANACLREAGTPLEGKPIRLWLATWLKERDFTPTVCSTTRDAAIRLSADGVIICPTASSHRAHSFVVPLGKRRVRLDSRVGALSPALGDTRRLGVRVSEIAIRSGAGEVVIPADDPSLNTGWHDAEHEGGIPWRWTDGAAELPWAGVRGPAIVTVRCVTLAEYPVLGETGGA